jgi:DNA-binding PadR family transcriptional regulator
MTKTKQAVDEMLPLPLATFHILMALAENERHGYAIIQEVSKRTGGELELSAGTLYRSIHRMIGQRLIAESRRRVSQQDDPRRRYYRITPFGRDVALAESRRLEKLVALARSSGFAPERA